jgi:hypothetical protein
MIFMLWCTSCSNAKNGWKNSGIPWTYDMDINLMYLPYGKPKTKSKGKEVKPASPHRGNAGSRFRKES